MSLVESWVWLFAQSFMWLSGVVFFVISALNESFTGSLRLNEVLSGIPMALPFIAQLIAGIVLWFAAPRIAARMLSGDTQPVARVDIDRHDVMAIASASVVATLEL